MSASMSVVMTTLTDQVEAQEMASQAVEQNLAACVQIIPQVLSVYKWKGSIQKESEFLLLFKSASKTVDALMSFIQTSHSYDTPEIIEVSAAKVDEKYLNWLTSAVSP